MARPMNCDLVLELQNVSLDTLFLIVLQAVVVIALGKFIHLSLRRHNQPSAISQILAGIMVGSLGLHEVIVHVAVVNVEDTYGWYVSQARIFYMFYVGLDADLASLWNDKHRCTIATYASVATCLLLAAFVSGGLYGSMMHTPVRSPELLAAVLMLTLANTSSVDVSRMAAELGLTATATGRLVVGAAIATNVICIVGEGVFSCMKLASGRTPGYSASQRLGLGVLALFKVGLALALLRPAVEFMNRRNAGRHRIGNWELALILIAVSYIGDFPRRVGFDGMPASLVLGLAFPREGPVARTVTHALAYPLHALALPFYFGTMGMRLNFSAMSGAVVVPAVLLTILGLVGKCAGTMGAARFLHMPLGDAARLGVILNIKGHVNMIDMSFASSEGIWAEQALMAMVMGSMISTVIAGPVFAVVYRREREAYLSNGHRTLERLVPDQEEELRMLACVHGARATPAMLSLVELLASKPAVQPAVHVLHFYDAVSKHARAGTGGAKRYHERVQIDSDKHWDRMNDAATQVNWTVDLFASITGLVIRQIDKGDRGPVTNLKTIRRCAEEVHADVLIVPYHKEQHYDGKMSCRSEDRRQLNLNVLERAPCTTGILVDRPFRRGGTSFQLPTKISTSEETLGNWREDRATAPTHVAAVFLGGPDDREAVALACRLAKNETVHLTVIRFVGPGKHGHAGVQTARADDHADGEVSVVVDDPDECCMAALQREYVAKELASYVEKVVGGAADVVEALRRMAGAYALVVVGRGGRQPAELLGGLECGEMGPIGDILASDESLEMGSVIVLQQKKAVSTAFGLDPPPAGTAGV
ncbi:cation/H(+) antiporter 2-like [Triticum urartu]|uniref:Cation/H+ exchanger domain-containing protein n=1 Tax=Triticum urartu TaxID=4572 RepID=A0A8R7QIQ9_TRIUA|nr:cation/H(+) antiporter 2-like [Triticum urartu]XP_048575200.1 cation/H(+) antiporter 2-like [Triticum urartu]